MGGRFWRVFDEIYVQVPVAVTNTRQHVLLEFSTVFSAFHEFSLMTTSQINLQHYRCFLEDDACAGTFRTQTVYLHASNIEYVFLSFPWARLRHSSIPNLQISSRSSMKTFKNQNKRNVEHVDVLHVTCRPACSA